MNRTVSFIILTGLLLNTSLALTQAKNGFDLSGSLIPPDEIHAGGPPRDGIPAIDNPKFVSPSEADFLQPENRVLGIDRNGVTKVYPIKIVNWHEIVNDRFGGEAVVVTYCPLCGSGVAFSAEINGKATTFGVSGLLYNNDVLLYDRRTESLWSQLMGKAVTGPLKGEELKPIPMTHTTWADWKAKHEHTLVLSTDTGYRRDYDRDPYAGYERKDRFMFPVSHKNDKYHMKETVVGIEIAGKFKAYPFSELEKTSGRVEDTFNGREIVVHYDDEHKTATVSDPQGNEIHSTLLYWFAWVAFHPDTEVFQAPKS